MPEIKRPEECVSIEDIRNEIDRIDEEIIFLFSERLQYVREIVKFKTPDKTSITAQERYDKVIANRGELASSQGLDRSTIENIYRILLGYYTQEQFKILENSK
jgi:isochorismate pyruvate lyase